MALLDALTRAEADALWWRLVLAAEQLADEVELLRSTPKRTRERLYGKGCAEMAAATMIEIDELVESELAPPLGPPPEFDLVLGGRRPGIHLRKER